MVRDHHAEKDFRYWFRVFAYKTLNGSVFKTLKLGTELDENPFVCQMKLMYSNVCWCYRNLITSVYFSQEHTSPKIQHQIFATMHLEVYCTVQSLGRLDCKIAALSWREAQNKHQAYWNMDVITGFQLPIVLKKACCWDYTKYTAKWSEPNDRLGGYHS